MARHFIPAITAAACCAVLYAQAAPDSSRVVRFDANLVQVDAVVGDVHGSPVRDLKAEDFRILQDGKSRKVTSCTYVGDQPRAPRTTVFLVNDGNMLATNMVRVREALSRLADDALVAGDNIAVLTTMGGAGYLRGFAKSAVEMHAAIDDLHWRPPAPDSVVLARSIELLRRTIVALAEMPGRKSLVVISDDMMGERFDLRSMADAASRASVVVYTVNPKAEKLSGAGEAFLPGLAAITGGLVEPGGLDLEANLRAVLADQGGHYLIAWDPGSALNQLWSWPVYHRITVKTIRPGLTVRSRDGFFGVSGPVSTNANASKMQQIAAALYAPLRTQPVHLRATPFYLQRNEQPVVQTVLYIGSGIEWTLEQDDCYRAALTIYSSIVPIDGGLNPGLAVRGAGLHVCGRTAQSIRQNGVIATIEQEVPGPGQYQVNTGVRNGTANAQDLQGGHQEGLIRRADWKEEAAKIGTASEFVEVPDTKLSGSTVPPLNLRGPGLLPNAEDKPTGINFRTVAAGDPAIRNFQRGGDFRYTAAANAKIQITRDGQVVDSADATGSYRIKPSLVPGQYLLEEKSADGESLLQWIDFRVVN